MKSEISPERMTEAHRPSWQAPSGQPSHRFTVQLSSTRRGVRLARRLAAQQLAEWGWPYDSAAGRDAVLLVAELAANAVQHGRLPGRDFRLHLAIEGVARLRIEVTDTRPDHRPPGPDALTAPPPDAESGRGLLIVDALADRWGTADGVGAGAGEPGTKTVWCERDLAPSPARERPQPGPAGAGRRT